MPVTIEEAKERLDYIINIARVDLYKPIQIAEVLFYSRTVGEINPLELETYRNPSVHWRNAITRRLTGKASTSSARYQHDVWNESAMYPEMLAVLNEENKRANGAIENYIYARYGERQGSDISRVLLGVDEDKLYWEQPTHIYRVGVTNAADRGLDMWANFGPVIQVKHLTLNENLAQNIVDQVESEYIVIVCRDADANVIQVVLNQIVWGRRVRGLVKESELITWYEKCLRGKFKDKMATPLLERLVEGFKAEFPQSAALAEFLNERSYSTMTLPEIWRI